MNALIVAILILVGVPCAALALSVVAACMLSSQISRLEELSDVPRPVSRVADSGHRTGDTGQLADELRKRAKYPCAHKALTPDEVEELRW